MSGRKGIGVKADDLLDRLEAKSREEIAAAQPRARAGASSSAWRRQIAIAALRFFMVKATTTRVIAFDFDEALNFEGETGPYLQYSLVRGATSSASSTPPGMATTVSARRGRGAAGGAVERRPLGPGAVGGADRGDRRDAPPDARAVADRPPRARAGAASSTPSTTATRSSTRTMRRCARCASPPTRSSGAGSSP